MENYSVSRNKEELHGKLICAKQIGAEGQIETFTGTNRRSMQNLNVCWNKEEIHQDERGDPCKI